MPSSSIYCFSLFHRMICLDPGCITTLDGVCTLEPLIHENARRTGAGLFGWSGTVGDDPLVWIEFRSACFQFFQRYVD